MLGIIFAAFLSIFGAAAPVLAQDTTPVPGTEAAKHLPSAEDLGKGWSLSQTVSPDILISYGFTMSPDTFREGAARIYLGPNGSQVVVVSLLTTTSRVAVRKSWDDASKILDGLGSMASEDYEKTRDLESSDPPTNCVEAKRSVGTEQFVGLPVGATMCAVDPDGILVAITFGNVNGNEGAAASDAVIEIALGAPPASLTPTTAA